jgi:hypothetical protein
VFVRILRATLQQECLHIALLCRTRRLRILQPWYDMFLQPEGTEC